MAPSTQQPGIDRRTALACLAGVALAPSVAAADHGFEVVQVFENPHGIPNGCLVQTPDGKLHGTCQVSGKFGRGQVFRSTTHGHLRTDESFSGGDPLGNITASPLCPGPDARLYGANLYGGTQNCGTLFAVEPTGEVVLVHDFDGTGANPTTAPTAASDGFLYGITRSGGAHNRGIFYRLSIAAEFTLLRDLEYSIKSSLIEATDGYFYAVTDSSGAFQESVIRLSRDGATLDVVQALAANGLEGTTPFSSLLQTADGHLVGTAMHGGRHNWGTVFRVGLNGGLTVLHHFTGTLKDSGQPSGALIEDASGRLYGAAFNSLDDGGAVYRLDPDGRLRVLHHFISNDFDQGYFPTGALLAASDGRLYGTTYYGGGIFRLKPG